MAIKLNDLLNLKYEELQNTKIRFAQYNGEENPIDVFKRNPDELMSWHLWNSQSFKVGQTTIGLVQIKGDDWLLFTVCKITEKLLLTEPGVGYKYKDLNYSDYCGRVIVKYHKKWRTQFPNALTVIDEMIVKEILPASYDGFDFPGYENVSLNYNELKTIIEGNYPSYQNALAHQQAVYVLTDKNTGKLYIGSATSKTEQLLSRWKGYINTFHNGNKLLIELYDNEGPEYFINNFQYSIIENYNSNVDYDYIIKRENYWKRVLDTRNHGYNKN